MYHHKPLFLPHSLTKDREDLEALSELGVLFLLFEMGLELSIDRLKVQFRFTHAHPMHTPCTKYAGTATVIQHVPSICNLQFSHPFLLQALAKYAFGMGTLQVIGCTGIFALCALPVGQGVATQVLEVVAGAPQSLVSIRTVDEV